SMRPGFYRRARRIPPAAGGPPYARRGSSAPHPIGTVENKEPRPWHGNGRSRRVTAATAIVQLPMNSIVTAASSFDYSLLSVETASNLGQRAMCIRQRVGKVTKDVIDMGRKTTQAVIDIGHDLTAAKQHLIERGQFVAWVQSDVGILARTAQNYMRAAEL